MNKGPGLIFPALLPFVCLTAVSGCGSGETLYPVAGRITFEGQPLTGATVTVTFKADATRGNKTPFEPIGQVDDQGGYRLLTQGREGAPPGWYKVVVTAFKGKPHHSRELHDQRPVVQSLLPARYGTAQATDLAVEVVESPAPGAYDLKLVKERQP